MYNSVNGCNSAWRSSHGWDSNYPGWHYQVIQSHFQQWFSVNMSCGIYKNVTGPRYQGTFNSSVLQKLITSVFSGCTCCNARMNVTMTWWDSAQFWQKERNFERKLRRKMGWKKWTGGFSHCSPDMNHTDLLLWGWMKSRLYHGGKPEGRHQ